MRALTICTKEFMLKIRDIIVKNHIAMFEVPFASQMHKYCRREKRIRADWQTALGRTTTSKMTVPTTVSNNVRSVLGKLPDLSYLLQRKEFRTSCV
ncbi:unnamed protein product [Echinostoma caproni]|uniref:THAP-type domain-containing protein n=1 Tax=Echinostoma caproni TaxID=27848 RepID=A0A183ACI3_9TREM|nr:unnamed protein product [Echinostoma caproni]